MADWPTGTCIPEVIASASQFQFGEVQQCLEAYQGMASIFVHELLEEAAAGPTEQGLEILRQNMSDGAKDFGYNWWVHG